MKTIYYTGNIFIQSSYSGMTMFDSVKSNIDLSKVVAYCEYEDDRTKTKGVKVLIGSEMFFLDSTFEEIDNIINKFRNSL